MKMFMFLVSALVAAVVTIVSAFISITVLTVGYGLEMANPTVVYGSYFILFVVLCLIYFSQALND